MGTTADKLEKLANTKSLLKSAINGSGSVVGDVFSDYPTAITNGKAAIAAAITDKGVQTAADATFQTMAENVGKIETGSKKEPFTISCYSPYLNEDLFLIYNDSLTEKISTKTLKSGQSVSINTYIGETFFIVSKNIQDYTFQTNFSSFPQYMYNVAYLQTPSSSEYGTSGNLTIVND